MVVDVWQFEYLVFDVLVGNVIVKWILEEGFLFVELVDVDYCDFFIDVFLFDVDVEQEQVIVQIVFGNLIVVMIMFGIGGMQMIVNVFGSFVG